MSALTAPLFEAWVNVPAIRRAGSKSEASNQSDSDGSREAWRDVRVAVGVNEIFQVEHNHSL
jgi:hypothetical protein